MKDAVEGIVNGRKFEVGEGINDKHHDKWTV